MKIMTIKKGVILALVMGMVFLVSGKSYSQEVVLSEVDEMPTPPGGMEGFIKYVMDNLKYPTKAKEDKIEGTVVLTFIVKEDGKVESVEVLRGIGGGCDEEAVRILENSDLWVPAKKEGKNVSARMRLPVRFKL